MRRRTSINFLGERRKSFSIIVKHEWRRYYLRCLY